MAAHVVARIDRSTAFVGRAERLADSHFSLDFSSAEFVDCETRRVIEKHFAAAVDDHDVADLERKCCSMAVYCRSIVLD